MADEPMSVDGEEVVTTVPEAAASPSTEKLAELKNGTANDFYGTKQYKSALQSYTDAIELCPNTARYYSNRAACYMMLGQYREALKDAEKCIDLDSKFVKAYVRVAKCSLVLGLIREAEATLMKVLDLDPSNKAALAHRKDLEHVKRYMNEGYTAYAAMDFRKVVFCMDRCCDVVTHGSWFKVTKAECLAFLGRYQEAQDIANDILHLEKQNVDAIYVRGMCLYFQNNVEKAFTHFQQVLRLAPDHRKALDIFKKAKKLKQKKEEGNAAFKAEKYKEAYDLYTEALTIDPLNVMTNAKLHFNKATVAAKLGRINESVTECTEALKLDENYLKALLRRASCYMELQQYEEAVRDFEKACKMDKSRDNKRLLAEAKLALKKSKRKDYYKILGIDKTASTDDIKKAYRKRAMVHHPDRHSNASDGEKKEQEKKFKEVGEAYGILSDPKKRSRYDSGQDVEDGVSGFQDMDQETLFQQFFSQHNHFHPGYNAGYAFHFA